MKIKKLYITDYGCLDKKEIEFNDSISVIKGNNESGKSTTNQALLALLFGFKNTGRGTKTFKMSSKVEPRKGGFPRIDALCTSGTDAYKASRYFEGGMPRLSVDKNGIINQLDNTALPQMGGLSRETYEGIYSLDIDQIVRLQESWEREQDSILAGLRSSILLPNDIVMKNLENGMKNTWRAKNTAKIVNDTNEEIARLKEQKDAAMENQQRLREIEKQQDETKDKIEHCKKQAEDLEMVRMEGERQKRFYEDYAGIHNMLVENSAAQKYDKLPKDAVEFIKTNQKELYDGTVKKEDIQRNLESQKQVLENFNTNKEKIDKCKVLVPKAEKLLNELKILNTRASEVAEKEKNKKSRLLDKVTSMFRNEFIWDNFKDLMNVDIGECQSVCDKAADAKAESAEIYQVIRESESPRGGFAKNIDVIDAVLFLLFIAGGVMIFMPLGINRLITIVIGALLLIMSAIGILIKRIGTKSGPDEELEIELDRLDREYNRLTDKLRDEIDFDFIPTELRSDPDETLIKDIAQIQYDYRDYEETKAELLKDRDEIKGKQDEIDKISQSILGASTDYLIDVNSMRAELDRLTTLEGSAQKSEGELGRLEEMLMDAKSRVYASEKNIKMITDAVASIRGNDLIGKARKLMDMREKTAVAVDNRERLRMNYKDYDELESKIGNSIEQRIYEIDVDIDRAAEAIESKREEAKDLSRALGELSKEREHLLNEGIMPAAIDSQLSTAYINKQQRIRLRDEYAVVYGIIKKARDRFMSERKPEFLDVAGEYLNVITAGQYRKIGLNTDGTSIVVTGSDSRTYNFDQINANLSRGTKEQVYFALRLAMLNRFDPDDDKLPIILDEALVNWDVDRFTSLMKIIKQISKERQVFMFTCHDYVGEIVGNVTESYSLIDI